ncbi:uncharacterized protein LOC110457159 isoform X2 [Mizuhopecten yessoensis]|nr:uncharacterized protein LOC110457159 isoform X2 [Mizuhopecten yessoensis]
MRGLIQQEIKQRRVHYLKSAAECTSRAIVSLELSEDPIKSVHQAEKLQGIGGETKKRLLTYNDGEEINDNPPKGGKFVSSAGAILLTLLEATEKALADDCRQEEVVLVPESEVKDRARQLSEESFLKDHDDGLCAAWWRMEVLIKRDLVKRRTLHKEPMYQLLSLGREAACHVKTRFTYPQGSDPNVKAVQSSGQNNFLYTNDKGRDGVILQVDHREHGGDRLGLGQLCDLLAGEGVTYRTRQLRTGDYQWVWRCEGQERDLPCIAERKRVDDMARTLKEGRFWTQVTKMKAFKAEFEERGVACIVHYLVEGNPENYVVRCGDGCQGVGRCGYPSLQQVKCAFRDLSGDKDLVAQATDDLQATVAVIASITTDLQQRTRKGKFDHLVALELDQPNELKMKVQTPLKCEKSSESKVMAREEPLVVDSDSCDSLDIGLHYQRPVGSKVTQTERSPKKNKYPTESSSGSRNRYSKENTPPPSHTFSSLKGTQRIPANPDDEDNDAYLDQDQHRPSRNHNCSQISNRTYTSEAIQTKSVSDLNTPNRGSYRINECEDWYSVAVTSPPQSSRKQDLSPLEPLVQYHCMGSYAGPSPSKRSRETSGSVYKPKMTNLSNSDVRDVYRPNLNDQTNSFKKESTTSYRPKLSTNKRPGDVSKLNTTEQRVSTVSPISKYRPKISTNRKPGEEYRPGMTPSYLPQPDSFKSYSSLTHNYRPKNVTSKNDLDACKPNMSSSTHGDEYDNTFDPQKMYLPKMSTSQGGQASELGSSFHNPGSTYNSQKYRAGENFDDSSATDGHGYKSLALHFEHVQKSPDVNSFGKRKIVNLDTAKQAKYITQQISTKTPAKKIATRRKTSKVKQDDVWLNDNCSDSSNDEDIDTPVVHKPVLREVTPKSKLWLEREADSDSDSLPCVDLGQEEDYDLDDLPDPIWQPPATKGHRQRTSPSPTSGVHRQRTSPSPTSGGHRQRTSPSPTSGGHRQRSSLSHRTQINRSPDNGSKGTSMTSPGPTKGTKGQSQVCSSQLENKIRLVNSVLPHVPRVKILFALELHSGNVDLCVASLLDDNSQ